MFRSLHPPSRKACFMSRSACDPGPALNQVLLITRSTPALKNWKGVLLPPVRPPKASFKTLIWSASILSETSPLPELSLMTWKYTLIVMEPAVLSSADPLDAPLLAPDAPLRSALNRLSELCTSRASISSTCLVAQRAPLSINAFLSRHVLPLKWNGTSRSSSADGLLARALLTRKEPGNPSARLSTTGGSRAINFRFISFDPFGGLVTRPLYLLYLIAPPSSIP